LPFPIINATILLNNELDSMICNDKISWSLLSENPNAISLLEQNRNRINWYNLSANPSAISLLEQNLDKIDWGVLSGNPAAMAILEQNQDKIDWEILSANPNAIYLLERNINKIDWCNLSGNPNAISLLERNPDKINWFVLTQNPNMGPLLDLFEHCSVNAIWYWRFLSQNPNIFEPDYQEMSKDRTKIIYQELMERALHPLRVLKWIECGFEFE
jgi:hypothetical protein